MSRLRLEIELDCDEWDRLDSEEKLCFLDMLKVKGDNLWHNNDIGDEIGNIKLLQVLEENVVDLDVLDQYDLYLVPNINLDDEDNPFYVVLSSSIHDLKYIIEVEGLNVDLDNFIYYEVTSLDVLSTHRLISFDWDDYIPYGYGYSFLDEFEGKSVSDILKMKREVNDV